MKCEACGTNTRINYGGGSKILCDTCNNTLGTVEENKSLLGKTTYRFNNQDFKTKEEAEAAKKNKSKRLQIKAQEDEIRRQIENELEVKRGEYDKDPMYLSMPIACNYIPDMKQGFFKKYESNLAAYVDLDALSRNIDIACRELYIKGYEVISITQAISGVGANTILGRGTAGAGWGYSFTNGAVITAKKR